MEADWEKEMGLSSRFPPTTFYSMNPVSVSGASQVASKVCTSLVLVPELPLAVLELTLFKTGKNRLP